MRVDYFAYVCHSMMTMTVHSSMPPSPCGRVAELKQLMGKKQLAGHPFLHTTPAASRARASREKGGRFKEKGKHIVGTTPDRLAGTAIVLDISFVLTARLMLLLSLDPACS